MVTGTADKTNQATEKAGEGIPPKAKTGLDKKEGGAETKPEKTYRQSEVDAMLGKAGQRVQTKIESLTTERNTYKSQAEKLIAEITEAKESIASLTKEIDAMSEDDPDKLGLVKLRKEKERELQAAKAERAEIAEARSEITQWKRDQLVYTVADEFVTASGEKVDFDSFKNAADKFKLSDREGLETLAETLGFKSKSEIPEEPPNPESPPLVIYSGKNEGGAGKLSLKKLMEVNVKKLTYQQRLEHKKALEEARQAR